MKQREDKKRIAITCFTIVILILSMASSLSYNTKASKIFTNKLEGNYISALVFDPEIKKLFIGTVTNGLYIYDTVEETLINRNESHGFPHITSLALDVKAQQLYIGTYFEGFGIYDISSDTFTIRNATHGLLTENITAVALDSLNEHLYIGGHGFSIFNINEGTFKNKNETDDLPLGTIYTISVNYENSEVYIGMLSRLDEDSNGYIGGGLSIFNPTTGSFRNRNITNGLPSNDILSLAFNRRSDELYIGTAFDGLVIYDIMGDSFSVKNMTDGLPSNEVSSITFNGNYEIAFLGTIEMIFANDHWKGGLSVYDIIRNDYTNWDRSSGLSGNNITALHFDNATGQLYIGAWGTGLDICNVKDILPPDNPIFYLIITGLIIVFIATTAILIFRRRKSSK